MHFLPHRHSACEGIQCGCQASTTVIMYHTDQPSPRSSLPRGRCRGVPAPRSKTHLTKIRTILHIQHPISIITSHMYRQLNQKLMKCYKMYKEIYKALLCIHECIRQSTRTINTSKTWTFCYRVNCTYTRVQQSANVQSKILGV